MSQVDALRMVDHLRERLVDLAVSENFLRDARLSAACRALWSGTGKDGGLVSELWVEGTFPGELSRDTLQTLTSDGRFPTDLCAHIARKGVFPVDRPLYTHQSEALRIASRDGSDTKPSLVITAGTGLGKTEAFLLPLLADFWGATERQQNGGMQCLILYPMNALVADQVQRIYRWLQGQTRVSVFHFTGETPEDVRRANQIGEPEWEVCRMRTRQEARGLESHEGRPVLNEPLGNVPSIVITNYSMLEYMLCRPQDSRFFGPDLRCVVLDEAHLYTGALAAEIMMLLRRVRARCGVAPEDILQIATSATLGGTDETLKEFACRLFSTQNSATHVLRGRHADRNPWGHNSLASEVASASDLQQQANLDVNTLTVDNELISEDEKSVDLLMPIVSKLVRPEVLVNTRQKYPATPAQFLYTALQQAPLVQFMASLLSERNGNILSVDELSNELFPEQDGQQARSATILLLRLAAAARMRACDLPLVPHRLHLLVRAPEGLSVCLNPVCSGPQDIHIEPIGCIQETGDTCRYCDSILLPVHRCRSCGEWALAAHENQDTFLAEPGYYARSAQERTFYLLTCPQTLNLEEVVIDPQQGELRGHGAPGVRLWKAPLESEESHVQQCPTCHLQWSAGDDQATEWRETCSSLIGGRPFALSVTAETVLHDLPPLPGPSHNWKPAKGRRLLCFSDSRASAARLGPLLTQQHEVQILRSAVARCIQDLAPADTASYLAEEVSRITKRLKSRDLAEGLRHHLRLELRQKEVELAQARGGTPFTDFATLVAARPEIEQILDRDTADRQNAKSYCQSDWRKNATEVKHHAEGLVAAELHRPVRERTSVESVGLVEIVYPGVEALSIPPSFEEELPSSTIRKDVGSLWPGFVSLLLDSVRADGCVSWSHVTPARQWLDTSPLMERWLTRTRGGWNARRFVGATHKQLRRRFAQQVLRAAGCSEEESIRLSEIALLAVFDQLFSLAGDGSSAFTWLRQESSHQTGPEEDDTALQVLMDHLSVRAPAHLFRCDATGTLWPHSALGWAPVEGCTGALREVVDDDMDEDPRWGRSHREFLTSPIFSTGLWAEEHSAQLSPRENRRLQDLFKDGVRNILSSTTTMELGIDIGGLNGVLLGNVPPGPANHRQRAGRSGRRSDGSAIVVTFARGSEFDRQVFRHFGVFLRRDLRRPTVFSDRKRIVCRHLYAVLLADFLRERQPDSTGAMHAFGRMGSFCGIDGDARPLAWRSDSPIKPQWEAKGTGLASGFIDFLHLLRTGGGGYQARLSRLARATGCHDIALPEAWSTFIDDAINSCERAIDEWNEELTQLREAWDEIPTQPRSQLSRERAKANAVRYQVNALCDITVIEWFADRRFLPRYGFPINLQSLTVRRVNSDEGSPYSQRNERYRLERSSLLALSEYVPESRVLVGGRVAISRGLRKHWTDSNVDRALGLEYYALECPQKHVYRRQMHDEVCPTCGEKPIKWQRLVFPRFGYTTASWEPPRRETNLERVGEQTVCPIDFVEGGEVEREEDFAGIPGVAATYKEEASLLVRNAGRNNYGFAICTRCGFALSENQLGDGRLNLPRDFHCHASVFATDPRNFCWGRHEKASPVLRNRVLAAQELTDMLLIEWPGATTNEPDGVYSLGRALILAGARLLELDERELGTLCVRLGETVPCR